MSADRPLSQFLFGRLNRTDGDDDALEPALADVLARARRAWPGLSLSDADFLGDLAERLPAATRLSDAVHAVCAEDLFLASLCRRGEARALDEFEKRVVPEVRAALLSRRVPAEDVDESLQLLRARLFVGTEGAPPKIAEYAARGPLVAWTRMAALRVAQNLKRKAPRSGEELRASQLAAPAAPPELGYIKARYRDDFKAAFEAAFAALSTRERTLLRLNLLDALGTSKLAKIYRADPSSVRRWLADARRHLLEQTRAALARRLDASERELDSMMGLLITQLEDSVRRILGEGRGAP